MCKHHTEKVQEILVHVSNRSKYFYKSLSNDLLTSCKIHQYPNHRSVFQKILVICKKKKRNQDFWPNEKIFSVAPAWCNNSVQVQIRRKYHPRLLVFLPRNFIKKYNQLNRSSLIRSTFSLRTNTNILSLSCWKVKTPRTTYSTN